ncbi:MAG: DUF3857 domain-containing protein [Bacteroidota bacterium]
MNITNSIVMNGRKSILPFLLLPIVAFSGGKYAVSAIPASLLPADAVIREHTIRFEVEDLRRATQTEVIAVTIFSKDEQKKGNLVLWYSKLRTVEELSGVIYDADGEEVRELDDDEIKDYSAVDENSLHDDSRVKYASMMHNTFPYTIEFRFEFRYTGSLSWPQWYSRTDDNPVEHSLFSVTAPKQFGIRYWCNRDSVHPLITHRGSSDIYTWEDSMAAKLNPEALDGDLFDAATIVKIAPNDFQVEDKRGSMKNWKELGQWYYDLTIGRLLLPESASMDVAGIMASSAGKRDLIRKLYEYMQSKTRYISIQLGIGGWQPFDATYVHNRGYGDCKALVNYMEALLDRAGIESYPVIINSGDDRIPMIREFPSNQFNHVILCVPFEKDSIWLECTSKSMPFGRLSHSTQDRPALLIAPGGGTVVRTPKSTAEENKQVRRANVILNSAGTAVVTLTTEMFGQKQISTQYSILSATPKERQDWLLSQMELGNIILNGYQFRGLEDRSPVVAYDLTATLSRYGSANGNRLFFHPSLVARRTSAPPALDKRISPIRFDFPYVNIDSIYFTIPEGYAVETLPSETTISKTFASFHGKTVNSGDSAIIYLRRTEFRSTEIPAAQYQDYRSFIADIVKADRSQVVLKKK